MHFDSHDTLLFMLSVRAFEEEIVGPEMQSTTSQSKVDEGFKPQRPLQERLQVGSSSNGPPPVRSTEYQIDRRDMRAMSMNSGGFRQLRIA